MPHVAHTVRQLSAVLEFEPLLVVMASKGAYARGTDGSDHAYRQRVVDRYTSLVVARRRVRGVLFVSGTIAALFAACTVLSAYAHRDGSVRRALDPRTTAIVVSGCLGAMLSVHGAWAIKRSATTRGRHSTSGTKTCALASAALGVGQGAVGLYSRIFNIDEQGGAAWLWSEALALAWKRVFKSPIEPGRFYPMCVNTETLAEMALIGLPLGVYGICLGIDSHSVKKNN